MEYYGLCKTLWFLMGGFDKKTDFLITPRVWAVVEEVAMYAKNDILVPLFVVIEGLIALLDLMLDWIMLYIFGPIRGCFYLF